MFLLTHHLPMNLPGTELSVVWDEVIADDALGKPPDYWYYGHSHHGVVYSAESAAAKEGTPCRVSGHGSSSHASPWELKKHAGPGQSIQWFANTPFRDDVPEHEKRILNGFTHVIFTENDVEERYINQKGQVEFEI